MSSSRQIKKSDIYQINLTYVDDCYSNTFTDDDYNSDNDILVTFSNLNIHKDDSNKYNNKLNEKINIKKNVTEKINIKKNVPKKKCTKK